MSTWSLLGQVGQRTGAYDELRQKASEVLVEMLGSQVGADRRGAMRALTRLEELTVRREEFLGGLILDQLKDGTSESADPPANLVGVVDRPIR